MNSGNTLLELLAIALLFGPFPIVYMTRGERDEHDVIAFVFAAIGVMLLMTFVSTWLIAVFLPIAWWYALKPFFKRFSARKKPY